MPVNPNLTRGHWDPKSDIAPVGDIEFAPDPRVSFIDSEEDVARGLLETSADLAAYDFMPNADVETMAIQSARLIIEDRKLRLNVRRELPEYKQLVRLIGQEVHRHTALRLTDDLKYTIRQSRISA